MTRFDPLMRAGFAIAAAGALALSGCNQAEQSVKDAATGVGDAAKTAANDAAQTALAPAVNPVLDLLKKSEGEVKGGNLAGAVATMGGFKALWDKAAPVIRPLAGDKWPAIETAANLVLTTFSTGAGPNAAAAGSAISGLIGPLSALMAK
ncbi:MAG: hypothetical protein R6W06_02765 [Prochlorococcaceae cyanobacterium]